MSSMGGSPGTINEGGDEGMDVLVGQIARGKVNGYNNGVDTDIQSNNDSESTDRE